MGTINRNLATLDTPAEGGFFFWAEVGAVEPEAGEVVDPAVWHYVGELSEDSIGESDNPDTPDAIRGQSRQVFIQPQATESPELTVPCWEVFNKWVSLLHNHPSAIVEDAVTDEYLGYDKKSNMAPLAKKFMRRYQLTDGTPAQDIWRRGTYVSKEVTPASDSNPRTVTVTYSLTEPTDGTSAFSQRKAPAAP